MDILGDHNGLVNYLRVQRNIVVKAYYDELFLLPLLRRAFYAAAVHPPDEMLAKQESGGKRSFSVEFASYVYIGIQ